MNPEYVMVLLSLVASAFFSGMEIAYSASNRLKIEVQKKQGTIQFLSRIMATPELDKDDRENNS
jgi:CBS domain containing-hemolysin-like protein